MTKKHIRIVFLVAGIILLSGLIVFYMFRLPKFRYSLLQSKTNEEAEHPLIVTVEDNCVKLELSIVGRVGEFDKVQFKKRLLFSREFPYFDVDRSIVLRFIDKDQKSKKSRTLYSFIGYIYNLREKEYKIRVEDTYKNLIDETNILVGPAEIINLDYCESASDCVPVGCSCDCNGCGGFSYEDVVNVNSVDAWYEENECAPAETCPQVCCPPRQTICKNNVCDVAELGKVNEE